LESQQDALGEDFSKARADYEATERSLEDQIESLTQALDDQNRGSGGPRGCSVDEYGTLLAQYEELKAELQEQREVCVLNHVLPNPLLMSGTLTGY